ncbi:MAG: methyltransferase domain-containing protein [Longimicrobiaceae bacterium]
MTLPALRRAEGTERMDEPGVERDLLADSLSDLRNVNRWLGGRRVVFRHLLPMLQRVPGRAVRVLDVATGGADIPLALSEWGRVEAERVEVVATDLHDVTLELARAQAAHDPGVRVERADALRLPYPDGSFDFALCSTALHHFDPAAAVRVLRELDRVATLGWVVNDLRRSFFGLLGARFLAATVWRGSPVTRHDGPLSVRRAYTPEEVAMIAHAAGIFAARVHTHFPFRLALVVDRTRVPG